MAKVISQETYDDAIEENVLEFGLNIQEAREETIKQFEAQVSYCVGVGKEWKFFLHCLILGNKFSQRYKGLKLERRNGKTNT